MTATFVKFATDPVFPTDAHGRKRALRALTFRLGSSTSFPETGIGKTW
jgi:hypothetical protein